MGVSPITVPVRGAFPLSPVSIFKENTVRRLSSRWRLQDYPYQGQPSLYPAGRKSRQVVGWWKALSEMCLKSVKILVPLPPQIFRSQLRPCLCLLLTVSTARRADITGLLTEQTALLAEVSANTVVRKESSVTASRNSTPPRGFVTVLLNRLLIRNYEPSVWVRRWARGFNAVLFAIPLSAFGSASYS